MRIFTADARLGLLQVVARVLACALLQPCCKLGMDRCQPNTAGHDAPRAPLEACFLRRLQGYQRTMPLTHLATRIHSC